MIYAIVAIVSFILLGVLYVGRMDEDTETGRYNDNNGPNLWH